ncbi:MAG: ABC transporter permease [Ktedonobacteraceae bacterium]|nr:ABC transporter permease [Ktedonobacteraceae bacterium]
MSTIATNFPTDQRAVAASHPRFFGIVRGEIFKVKRMWSIWISLVLMLGAICLPYLITLSVKSQGDFLKKVPLQFFYDSMQQNLFVLRVFIGFFLLILTACVFGREYQLGTIRILMARGVGRLQLLFAKLLAVILIALFVLLIGLALNVLLQALQMTVLAGNFDGLKALDADFWHNTEIYMLTVLISMGVTILLTVALTALGRSFVFGLSASLAFFPADNIGTVFMRLGYLLTHNDFWRNATTYFLGPNLNAMPASIVPQHFSNYGAAPLVQVDGTHTLIVAGVYGAVFLLAAVVLTWRRDVKE